ncbi:MULTISPECIES: hypothetical protein [Bacillus]|uniref:hypothetical protein n=1 Tax=Bacillus TaxID=1386 RepID=UPI0007DB09F6|nr:MULTISPECIES: hypothetical protein [Bacillus]OUB86991.1 hypothetical protein BK788_07625 [Bacillus thuringiensis serovar sinensis]KAA0789377.1 hypothetical protein DN393_11885 [Bacillus sp. BPN334]MBY7111815.1 hypothetical protein [Bacillus sp. 17RED48]MCR6848230.1 hypothetical protein [Bacillus sp. IBL03825]MCU5111786.1 hypothetical protein [Bacillus wiedmannii]
MFKNTNVLLCQIEIVIEITKNKQKEKEDPFYEDLLKRLNRLANYLQSNDYTNDGLESRRIKGAVRAYTDTGLVKSFDDPLLIELDKLETMLNEN